jgi:TonB family protein
MTLVHRGVLAIVLLVASGATGAAEPRFTEQTVAGETREVGDVKWTYELYRAATLVCPKSKPGDCVRNSVNVRNGSSRAIQCHVVLEQPRKDDARRKIAENDVVIYAGRGAKLAMSYGPVALVPRRFEATCVAIPATIEPYSMTKECFGLTYAPPVERFYPPGARRRKEEGDVIIEYSVQRRSYALHDVLVLASSGFEEIDNAALALSKAVTVRDQCVGRRYRMRFRFLIAELV